MTKLVAQYYDAIAILERFAHRDNPRNYPAWENANYRELLQHSFCTNSKERSALLQQAEQLFIEEMPIAPLFHPQDAFLLQPHLRGEWGSPFRSIALETLAP